MKYENNQQVRHKLSSCHWKNSKDKLATLSIATNLQIVKKKKKENAVFAKDNEMR